MVDLQRFNRITAEVLIERGRQEILRERGKFSHTAASPGATDVTNTRVLQEEIDEVLDEADALRRTMGFVTRRVNDHAGNASSVSMGARANLRKELIQVAAVAVAWAERLDTEDDAKKPDSRPALKIVT